MDNLIQDQEVGASTTGCIYLLLRFQGLLEIIINYISLSAKDLHNFILTSFIKQFYKGQAPTKVASKNGFLKFFEFHWNRTMEKINLEKRELIATFYQSDLSELKTETAKRMKDAEKDRKHLEKEMAKIKNEFEINFMKLQEYKATNEPRRRTSESIDTFTPQSIHRLSLQKLRLAKPLAEAKQELDERIYFVECQRNRVKLGSEMIKRLNNGANILKRVNSHNQYRLEMAVEYSDKQIFKKVENDDTMVFKPNVLPLKKFVVPM